MLLVFGSVLVGARVLAHADDTVAVLAARGPLVAGQQVEADDVAVTRLRFSSAADADRYLPEEEVPTGAVLLRPVGPGELLPRAAVDVRGSAGLVELPLGVDPARVPAGVHAGAIVDVWAVRSEVDQGERPERLLAAVPVLSAARGATAGVTGLRQVVVGVAESDQPRVSRVVARLGDETALVLVRRPGVR